MQRVALASLRALVGAALTLAVPCFAQETPQAIVHGTVVDASSDQPITQARVTLNTDPLHETLTDKDGEFRFPPGRFGVAR